MNADPTPESARQLLYRHGLPEDVIDGVLCLHAQELAAVIRREAAVWGVDTAAGKHTLAAADLIDPTRTVPAVSVAAPPADLRDRIAEAEAWLLHFAAAAHHQTRAREDPARIDRLRPEFFEHASVESIDFQIQRAQRQQRNWGNRERTLAILRQARVTQKEHGEWPAVVSEPGKEA